MPDKHVPVLIVGEGLTGLSTALFLAWHGVPPLLVERHPDLPIHPRARGFTPRTVEILRQAGLEPAIRAASYARADDFTWVGVRARTLADAEYQPVDDAADEGFGDASPAPFGAIDQDKLEIILRARAEALGADVRFSTELTGFEAGETGVTAEVVDRRTGARSTVTADYLVAADGWDSPIRQALGIALDGPGVFFHTLSAVIEADLRPALRGRRVSIAYLEHPRPGTVFLAHDDAGLRWVFGVGYAPERGESPAQFTEARAVELVRAASGLPDVAVTLRPQIPGTDLTVLGCAIGAQLARCYRSGRVFLVGDAAHIVPPTGGLGANTGIQDAHNLAWKLAAVVRGQADPDLLETYHAERYAVGLLTMRQALARWGSRVGAGAPAEADPLLHYTAVAFGYRYRSAAVLGAPDDPAPALLPAELAAQPGTRAPHVPATRDGHALSTIDLYGRGFVLLAGPGGEAWLAAARQVARRLDLPIDAYRFGVELRGADAAARHPLGPDGAILVRPDGFVAWRAEALSSRPARDLEDVLGRLLARETAPSRPAG